MDRKNTRNFMLGIVAVCGTCAGTLFLKKFYDKNSLRLKKLINKDTEILNVYTADYVISAIPFVEAVDEKSGSISSVYTSRAKKEADFLGIFSDNTNFEKIFKKEYSQIERFAVELNKIAPNATMVIHVISETEAKKYYDFEEKHKSTFNLNIEVVINRYILENMFEEE